MLIFIIYVWGRIFWDHWLSHFDPYWSFSRMMCGLRHRSFRGGWGSLGRNLGWLLSSSGWIPSWKFELLWTFLLILSLIYGYWTNFSSGCPLSLSSAGHHSGLALLAPFHSLKKTSYAAISSDPSILSQWYILYIWQKKCYRSILYLIPARPHFDHYP